MATSPDTSFSPDSDPIMWVWASRNPPLITREIAIAVARLVISEGYGNDELRKQEPLEVEDAGFKWIIRGSGKYLPELDRKKDYMTGSVLVEIRKTNCQILNLALSERPVE